MPLCLSEKGRAVNTCFHTHPSVLRHTKVLTFAGGERPCNTAFGTLDTAHSACRPFLPPSLYSASLEEEEALDLDPRYTQNLCGRVCLDVNKKLGYFHKCLYKWGRKYFIQFMKVPRKKINSLNYSIPSNMPFRIQCSSTLGNEKKEA